MADIRETMDITAEERDWLVETLVVVKHDITTCDEEGGDDGLCDCLRAIGGRLLEQRREAGKWLASTTELREMTERLRIDLGTERETSKELNEEAAEALAERNGLAELVFDYFGGHKAANAPELFDKATEYIRQAKEAAKDAQS